MRHDLQSRRTEGAGLLTVQRRRLAQHRIEACVDAHCHPLPGLDDGPADLVAAMTLCRALAADGITTVIATPHQLGRFEGRGSPEAIRRAVETLSAALRAEGVPLAVVPGAEVRIDERIPRLLASGELLTLAGGGRHLLVELPSEVCINPIGLVRELAPAGVTVIVAHPERCGHLCRDPQAVMPWVRAGAALQVTAAGVAGLLGPAAQRACWTWLASGAAAMVATDAHDAFARRPCMSRALALIGTGLGAATARRVCLDNPLRVLTGEAMETAPAGDLARARA